MHTLGRAQGDNHFFFFSLLICFHNRHTEGDFDIARIGLTADGNLVDFQLGRVGQKCILDPDLRGILSRVVLNADKMISYQDQDLFLITSVVYNEKFEVVVKVADKRNVRHFLYLSVGFYFHIISRHK